VTYLLEDYRGKPVAGGFYEYELPRVANPDIYLVEKVLHKKGNKVYVKWLGFDDSYYNFYTHVHTYNSYIRIVCYKNKIYYKLYNYFFSLNIY